MKRKYFMLGSMALLIGAFVCLGAYADKKKGGKVELPAPVKDAVESAHPQSTIEKVKLEEEGLKLYEIEVTQNDKEYELTVAPDGTIVEEEQEGAENLPDAVKTAIAGAEIHEVSRQVAYWVITLKKLDKPKVTYEVELTQNGQKMEIEFAADGTILEKEVKKEDDEEDQDEHRKGKHDDDDEEDKEQSLSLDQVPAAVEAIILQQAKGDKVKEIEQDDENGKGAYEADIVISGKEYELKISADGKLLSKKAEHDNDKDEDDDD